MIETRGARPLTRWVSFPLPVARHPHEGREVFGNAAAAHRRRSADATVARFDARHGASGATALGASSDRASRQYPSRDGA